MHDLFMTICALTMLSCSDVNVQYYSLPDDIYGVAGIDRNGQYHVLLDEDVKREKKHFKRNLLIHEIAHLLVYQIDPTNNTHDEVFDDVCEELSLKMGVRPKHVCRAHHGPPSIWNTRSRHYRLDE